MELQRLLLTELIRRNQQMGDELVEQLDVLSHPPKKGKKRAVCDAELAVLTAAMVAYANNQLNGQALWQVVMAAQQSYQLCQYT